MNGMELIKAERVRQIEVEGWTVEHDQQHSVRTLCAAALCYMWASGPSASMPRMWPEDWCWKPQERQRNLERAGALYLAARDRADDDTEKQLFASCAHTCAELLDRLLDMPENERPCPTSK